MKSRVLALGLAASTIALPAWAAEGPSPQGVPTVDHVFLIMMENHGFTQIMNNPSAPAANWSSTSPS